MVNRTFACLESVLHFVLDKGQNFGLQICLILSRYFTMKKQVYNQALECLGQKKGLFDTWRKLQERAKDETHALNI